jgi:hypothetical protein
MTAGVTGHRFYTRQSYYHNYNFPVGREIYHQLVSVGSWRNA